MRIIKLIIRVAIALVLCIPSYPILFAAFSIMGIALIISALSLFALPFVWLIGNKSGIDDCIEFFGMGIFVFIAPFGFWLEFVKGNNPFKEFDL